MGVDAAARAARPLSLPPHPPPPGPGRRASVPGALDRGRRGRGGQACAAAGRRRAVATLPPSVDGPFDARVHLRRVFAESSVKGGEFRPPPRASGVSPPPGGRHIAVRRAARLLVRLIMYAIMYCALGAGTKMSCPVLRSVRLSVGPICRGTTVQVLFACSGIVCTALLEVGQCATLVQLAADPSFHIRYDPMYVILRGLLSKVRQRP